MDPDWIRIRIGLQPQTLDPDPEKMNTDPKPWYRYSKTLIITYYYSNIYFFRNTAFSGICYSFHSILPPSLLHLGIIFIFSGEGERCYEGAKSAAAAASPSYTRPSFSSPPQHHPCHNPISVRITGVTEIALGGSGGFPSPCGSNRSGGGTTFLPHTTTSDSEVGVASGVGAETSLKVGSGSWVGSEKKSFRIHNPACLWTFLFFIFAIFVMRPYHFEMLALQIHHDSFEQCCCFVFKFPRIFVRVSLNNWIFW